MRSRSLTSCHNASVCFLAFRTRDGLYLSIDGRMRGLSTHRGTAPAPEHGARLCRTRDRAPRAGVGRSLALPPRNHPAARQAGTHGLHLSRRVRRLRPRLHRIRARHRGALARRWLGRHHRRRPHLALLQPHLSRRQRRAEAPLHPAPGHRRAHRRLGAHRTQQRLRRRQRALHRHSQGRPLGAQRHQDVHHQRLLRRRRAWSSP